MYTLFNEVNFMKNKFLAVFLCVAMLVSVLSVYTYAASTDVEINIGDLFDDEPVINPDDGKEEDKKEDDKKEDGNKGNNKGNREEKEEEPEETTPSDDKKEEDKKEESKVDGDWTNPFVDVKRSDWFYDTVKYVNMNGIINGMTEDTFAPGATLTRAMLVTILYRSEGSPKVSAESKFSDIKDSDWFAAPVIWASENGIVNGVSETEFAPNNAITREQIATIMYRYATSRGHDVSVGQSTNILSYEDVESVSEYAFSALQYTAGAGIMKGKTESTLNPQDKATRAEAATVVMRFIEYNKNK